MVFEWGWRKISVYKGATNKTAITWQAALSKSQTVLKNWTIWSWLKCFLQSMSCPRELWTARILTGRMSCDRKDEMDVTVRTWGSSSYTEVGMFDCPAHHVHFSNKARIVHGKVTQQKKKNAHTHTHTHTTLLVPPSLIANTSVSQLSATMFDECLGGLFRYVTGMGRQQKLMVASCGTNNTFIIKDRLKTTHTNSKAN